MVNSIDDAVALVAKLLSLPEYSQLQAGPIVSEAELAAAIERHDMPALYRNLMDAFSYQGIADGRARNYIAAHGNAEWLQVEEALVARPTCPKLLGFAAFRGCGYQKM